MKLDDFIDGNEVVLCLDKVVGPIEILFDLNEFDFGEERVEFFECVTDGTLRKVIFGLSFQDIKVKNLISVDMFEGPEKGIGRFYVFVSLKKRAVDFIDGRVEVWLLDFHLNKI